MKLKRLYKDWRKASLALPLAVTILLAVAMAGVATYTVVTYRAADATAAERVTAYGFKARFDAALASARAVSRGEGEAAGMIADIRSFDIEFMQLRESPNRARLQTAGMAREYAVVEALAARIDAYVTGDPDISRETLFTELEAAAAPVSALAWALKADNDRAAAELRDRFDRGAGLLVVLVGLFIVSLAVLLPVEWHRRKSLLAKTRALEISEGKLRDLSFYRQQFLANMSHEFRTPLNAIQGFSEAILIQKDTMKQERVFEYVDIVSRSAKDLARLTEDVLDLSKIDAGKFDIQREDASFTSILEDTIVQFQAVAEQREITIRAGIEADWTVNCDRLAVKRCISNVLSNALKFSDKGGAIYVDAYLRDRRLLVVEVRDVGCGIPERDLQSIWMVYARSSLTRKSDREGAGLGLAMVKALMDAHNGFVELQSREGVGTSVRLCFPLTMVVATHWRDKARATVFGDEAEAQLKAG